MYFGSVRFFRHLIVAVIVLLIAVPTALAIVYGVRCAEMNGKLLEVEKLVRQYGLPDGSELEKSLSTLLSDSSNRQTTAGDQKVDASVSEQLELFKSEVNSALDSQFALLQESLSSSVDKIGDDLDGSTEERVNEIKRELSALIKDQMSQLEKRLGSRIDAAANDLIVQVHESLGDQLALLQRQIDEIKSAQQK